MDDEHGRPTRIVVVGAGRVGATFAYTLLLSGQASEIVLIDANFAKAEGEALDLNHSMPLIHATRIWAGDYPDCAGAQVTVITAGLARQPGDSRLDLVNKNTAIFRQIIPAVAQANPGGILLVATNPVDVLTYAAWKLSGFPAAHVIGSGTVLDTARFRYLLGEHCRVDPRSVHANIAGEHGDSEVPLWSLANIAGMHLPDFCAAQGLPAEQEVFDEIFRQTRDAAPPIIARKGATYYSIAAALMRIVEAILRNQRTVLSVSSPIQGLYGIDDVCLSLPSVVGRTGIEHVLALDLAAGEIAGLRHSAGVLKETIAQAGIGA